MCSTAPLAIIVYLLHALLIGVMFYYALLAPSKRAIVATVLISLMFLNWYLDPNGNCFLTVLEARLRCQKAVPGFTQRLIYDITGLNVNEDTLYEYQIKTFSILLAISILRYVYSQMSIRKSSKL